MRFWIRVESPLLVIDWVVARIRRRGIGKLSGQFVDKIRGNCNVFVGCLEIFWLIFLDPVHHGTTAIDANDFGHADKSKGYAR